VTVLAEVVRSGVVESVHRGSLVGLDASGAVTLERGKPTAAVFPRSCNKPLQAVGMVRTGFVEKLGLEDRHLALASASHNGEQQHVDVVRDTLARADVPESALQCPHALPLHEESMHAMLARGSSASRITHNCSGKHAAMLATCAANGWPTATYLEVEHPLQVAIREAVEELCAEKVSTVGVDGCGAPLFALTLVGLARGFARVATASEGAEAVVAQAMRTHPDLVGGTGRDVTALMRAVPGLIAKDGAEACYAAATSDGRAVAFKLDDGYGRGRSPVMVAALRAMGVVVEGEGIAEAATPPVLGGGHPVGEIHATL
jgi:L-asparaginase II